MTSTGTKIAFALVASAALAAAASAQLAAQGGYRFEIQLTDEEEVSPAGLAGGDGTAILTINPGQKRVCYQMTLNSVVTSDGVIGAHIHSAIAGVAGPIVVPLFSGSGGTLNACTTSTLSSRQLAQIIANPHLYYVNVHSTSEPAGAVRGQLARRK